MSTQVSYSLSRFLSILLSFNFLSTVTSQLRKEDGWGQKRPVNLPLLLYSAWGTGRPVNICSFVFSILVYVWIILSISLLCSCHPSRANTHSLTHTQRKTERCSWPPDQSSSVGCRSRRGPVSPCSIHGLSSLSWPTWQWVHLPSQFFWGWNCHLWPSVSSAGGQRQLKVGDTNLKNFP